MNFRLKAGWPPAMLCLTLSALAGTPALIPAPQEIEWTGGELDCSRYELTAPTEAGLAARELEQALALSKKEAGGTRVLLQLGAVAVTNAEAYTLDASPGGIVVTAPKSAGLFYGVETLRQLLAGTRRLPCCRITDWPAFGLRGFMHDTGRNFQTLDSLMAQLDIFAAYKLNVFHWHLTDNPAWRVECLVFPQLNDPKYQTRDPGKIYSYDALRELIRYARDRHITVIPELDMPGHSACFERAMGFSMGSEQGMDALDKIIEEFCREIPVAECPRLHLGSDEVRISHPREFMERMLKRARADGRQVCIWNPGLTGDEQTVMQLWRDGSLAGQLGEPRSPFLDSAGGYLNGYDPLVLVQRYFFRQPCGVATGDSRALGAILCCWPDVRVADKINIFRYNPVWPGLLAFSDAVWHGVATNRAQFFTELPPPGSAAGIEFRDFENRLAFHRDHYFSGQPFPFVKTASIVWNLAGPFYRGTNDPPALAFAPERSLEASYRADDKTVAWRPASGGTITDLDDRVGVDKKRRSSATAYACTRIFAETNRELRAWIGFETPTRSNRQCGGIPPAGQWSPFGAQVWINGAPVPAPHWRQPGKNQYLKPTWSLPANEIPFTDEEFYWTREPATLHLHAGWNQVLLRIPCGYAEQQWSFTFIPVKPAAPTLRWIEDESVRFSTELK